MTNLAYGVVAKQANINVIANNITHYTSFFNVGSAASGQAVMLRVTSATDAYGNPATGTAIVSITNGAVTSYVLNNIVINNGIGSNSQIVYTATTNRVGFRVRVGSYSNLAALSNIHPTATIGSLSLLSTVSTVTAGKPYNTTVQVQIKDLNGNIKTDATNTVLFRSTDLRLGRSNATYKFLPVDKGIRIFGKEYFTNKTAGLQTLIVTEAALRDPGSAADVPLMAHDRITVFDLQSSRDRVIEPLLEDLKAAVQYRTPEQVVASGARQRTRRVPLRGRDDRA